MAPETAVQPRSRGARRAILDATRGLLAEPGSGGAGMERIAERAGFSRQAIYRNFGSRAGLLRAVLADIDERGDAEGAVTRVLEAGDGAGALRRLVDWWADYVAGFVAVSRTVYAGRVGDPALAAAWDDRMCALLGVCRAVADRCAADGQLADDVEAEEAAEMIWALLSIPLWDQLIGDRGWSRAAYRRRIGLLASAIAPGGGRAD